MPELKSVVVTLEDHRARMLVDPEKLPLQDIIAVVVGTSGKYTPRLLLHVENRSNFPALKTALESVKGVRYAREPNDKGLFLVDLRKEEKTTLRQIQEAAAKVAVKLGDAPLPEKNTSR